MNPKLLLEIAVMATCIEAIRTSGIDDVLLTGLCLQWERLESILTK